MGEKALGNYSYQEYLDLEASSETKYEFHDGFITAMAGGSPAHSQIAGNVIRFTGNDIDKKNKPCIVHTSDLRIRVERTKRTYYPDISVVCEDPVYSSQDAHALTNPVLVIEVLSESTAAFDRGGKFTNYRQIPSLREYVLISQEEPVVDTYYRTEDNLWEINTIMGLKGIVVLKSIGCELKMSDIYSKVPDIPENPPSLI